METIAFIVISVIVVACVLYFMRKKTDKFQSSNNNVVEKLDNIDPTTRFDPVENEKTDAFDSLVNDLITNPYATPLPENMADGVPFDTHGDTRGYFGLEDDGTYASEWGETIITKSQLRQLQGKEIPQIVEMHTRKLNDKIKELEEELSQYKQLN